VEEVGAVSTRIVATVTLIAIALLMHLAARMVPTDVSLL
jgi:hypothetical protein